MDMKKGWGQPLGFQSFSKGTDVIAIPFLNLGTNGTLEEFIAIENAKLFNVGGWLIFADNAIISFPNGMPNFA